MKIFVQIDFMEMKTNKSIRKNKWMFKEGARFEPDCVSCEHPF
jgi:hypothetical protein